MLMERGLASLARLPNKLEGYTVDRIGAPVRPG